MYGIAIKDGFEVNTLSQAKDHASVLRWELLPMLLYLHSDYFLLHIRPHCRELTAPLSGAVLLVAEEKISCVAHAC